MNKKTALWLGVAVLMVGSLVIMATSSQRQGTSGGLLASAISATDRVFGTPDATVELIEYADFQCPACKLYHPWLQELKKEFDGKIKFAFRHFPLRNIHQNADPAAQAAEAAGLQGKFWEMHDQIFEHQSDWAKNANAKQLFEGYASKLGLDLQKFKSDLTSEAVLNKINADLAGGLAIGINHTPTFFLNGHEIENPMTYEEFRNAILQALNGAK